MVIRLLCKLDRHEPVRRDALWDGRHYVGQCLHCGTAIRRKGHGNWRADWLLEP